MFQPLRAEIAEIALRNCGKWSFCEGKKSPHWEAIVKIPKRNAILVRIKYEMLHGAKTVGQFKLDGGRATWRRYFFSPLPQEGYSIFSHVHMKRPSDSWLKRGRLRRSQQYRAASPVNKYSRDDELYCIEMRMEFLLGDALRKGVDKQPLAAYGPIFCVYLSCLTHTAMHKVARRIFIAHAHNLFYFLPVLSVTLALLAESIFNPFRKLFLRQGRIITMRSFRWNDALIELRVNVRAYLTYLIIVK